MSTTIPPNNNTGLYSNLGRQPAAANVDYSTTGNITAGGYISATGNISTANSLTGNAIYTNNYFYANGQPFTGSASNYGNGNVVSLMAAFGSNVISTTGNVTAGYVLGNGSQLTGLPATYSNANVTTLLASFGSNTISTTGNITAGYVLGNGSQLTGLPATYSNANVTTLLASFGSNSISTTGNISAGTVSATGNITAAYILGNGSQLTGLPSGYSNANVAAYLPTYSGNIGNGSGPIALVGSQANIYSNDWILLQSTTPTADGIRLVSAGNATITLDTRNLQLGNNTIVPTLIQFGANANINFNLANATGANLLTSTTVSATGNITGGNLLTGGQVSAVGNITGNYFIGNGSQLTGIATSSYSNSNVVTLLASFGSNTISTSGNITAGNLSVTGIETDTGNITGGNILTGGVISATANITGGNIVTTGQVTATANVTAGNLVALGQISAVAAVYGGSFNTTGQVSANYVISGLVTYANTGGSAGQVLTAYGNGQTYFSTVSSGGSPGGSNTQIQYNNAGAFAGNGLMAFDQTTGNISLGNLVLNTNNMQTNVSMNMANATGTIANGNTTPWRINMGNGYQGSFSPQYDYSSAPYNTAYPRLLLADYITVGSGLRNHLQTTYFWCNVSANISNTATRINPTRSVMVLGGGTNNSTFQGTNQTGIASVGSQIFIGASGSSTANALTAVGNITISSGGVVGVNAGVQVNAGSTANLIGGFAAQLQATDSGGTTGYGNAQSAYGFYDYMIGNLSNTAVSGTNLYVGYYHPGTTTAFSNAFTMGSIARSAGTAAGNPQYWAFRNDDNLARTRLGSVDRLHYWSPGNASVSGSVAVDKTNGQFQQFNLTGNITITGFTNFVTQVTSPNSTVGNVYQTDVVTVLLNQGTTGGYGITLPTTANIKYANGINTVSTITANTITTLTITGYYNLADSATEYLVAVSPAYQ